MAMLEVKNLSNYSFGGLKAVDDFNITIEKGQLYGSSAPNGAGKDNRIQPFDRRVQAGRRNHPSGTERTLRERKILRLTGRGWPEPFRTSVCLKI